MKKTFLIFAVAAFFVACNNSADSTNREKDSLDSIAKLKKDVIDSTAGQKKDMIDSTTQAKKDMIDSTAKKDTSKKK